MNDYERRAEEINAIIEDMASWNREKLLKKAASLNIQVEDWMDNLTLVQYIVETEIA